MDTQTSKQADRHVLLLDVQF